MNAAEDAAAVTLATIREWAEGTVTGTVTAPAGTHAAGMRTAARDVLAILDMHGRPGEPVIFGEVP